jgi:hypothetical protein
MIQYNRHEIVQLLRQKGILVKQTKKECSLM